MVLERGLLRRQAGSLSSRPSAGCVWTSGIRGCLAALISVSGEERMVSGDRYNVAAAGFLALFGGEQATHLTVDPPIDPQPEIFIRVE